jgi:hypothetical protein
LRERELFEDAAESRGRRPLVDAQNPFFDAPRTHSLSLSLSLVCSRRYLDGGSNEPAVICPYYRSEYGRKRSEGVSVEEGEGLGPRKELFVLLSEQFQRKYKKVDEADVVVCSGDKGSSTVDVDGEIDPGVKAGAMLKWGESGPSHVVARVDKKRNQIVLDGPLGSVLRKEAATLHKSCVPLLVYKKEGECLWINTSLGKSPAAEADFRVLGLLLALATINQCQLDLDLPNVFFKVLLDPNNKPALADLEKFDGELLGTLNKVRQEWSDSQIREVLEMEGVRVGSSVGREELLVKYAACVGGGGENKKNKPLARPGTRSTCARGCSGTTTRGR